MYMYIIIKLEDDFQLLQEHIIEFCNFVTCLIQNDTLKARQKCHLYTRRVISPKVPKVLIELSHIFNCNCP